MIIVEDINTKSEKLHSHHTHRYVYLLEEIIIVAQFNSIRGDGL